MIPVCRTSLLLVVTVSVAAPVAAQAVVEFPDARVEVRGLQVWNTGMLQDSLRVHAPGESLASHACAAVLRQRLGFADAAVRFYPQGYEGRTRREFILTVVEPQDSAFVEYRSEPPRAGPPRAEWEQGRALMSEHPTLFQMAVRRALGPAADDDPEEIEQIRAFFRHVSERDLSVLASTLAEDGNAENRAIAAALLVRFAAHDEAWLAAVHALRDPSAQVRVLAGHALHALTHAAPRPVRWEPARESLRWLLNGTNLFAFDDVVDALAHTADAAFIRTLLTPRPARLLVEMLHSIEPAGRERAERLLVVANEGRRLGSPAEWREWLASLPPARS